ncbi:hypothetical protein TWF173_002245 [Orbilia oligospora]|nr:hypothetical protein TWF173_002245 [Orbilia oligospora]
MAPITTLSPELLLSITEYISSRDILNFGLSCKSLFPVCYRALWSYLGLTPSTKKKGTWPGLQITHRFKCKVRETIENFWVNSPGLVYTKHVDFGKFICGDGDEASILMQLLEDGKLSPRCIDFSLSVSDITSMDQRPVIKRLKKYTESKSLKELKAQLYSEAGYSLSATVDLAKVTKLTFNISSDGYRPVAETEERVPRRIQDITAILRKAINLRYFSWKAETERKYSFGYISEELKDLQEAFTSLQRLKTLKIENYLFHPSFFLKPPDSVQNLILNCVGSTEWWNDFSACPLTNVIDLRFHRPLLSGNSYSNELRGFLGNDDNLFPDTIKIEKIAVRNLETFLCPSEAVPQELGFHILKGNPKLKPEYKLELSNGEAKRFVKKHYNRFESNWGLSKSYLEDLYIRHYLNNPDPMTELEVIEMYCQMCFMGEIENGYVTSWDNASKRATDIGERCKADLEERFPNYIKYGIHHYTLEFMKGLDDVDDDEFKKECIRLYEEDDDRGQKYFVARSLAGEILPAMVNKFRRAFDSLRKKIVKDVAEKIFKGSDTDEKTLMSSWIERTMAQLQDFGVNKLSLEEVTGENPHGDETTGD